MIIMECVPVRIALSAITRVEESFTGAFGPCCATGGNMELRLLEEDILIENREALAIPVAFCRLEGTAFQDRNA